MPEGNKTGVVIAVIAVTALIGGIGAYVYINRKKPTPPNPNPGPTPTPTNNGDMSWCTNGFDCTKTRKTTDNYPIVKNSYSYLGLGVLFGDGLSSGWKYTKANGQTCQVTVSGFWGDGPIQFKYLCGQVTGIQTFACWSCTDDKTIVLYAHQDGTEDVDDGRINLIINFVNQDELQVSHPGDPPITFYRTDD